ncbi:MAG: hypothetical protein H6708_32375 [Kofleriaceae bacterium]|nr:hypothetical protein [Kofleriaceae bacterium]
MARDVLGDAARAERCWQQVADAGDAHVLDKLLALQRRRGATVERADTCERRARLCADDDARRALLIEAGAALLAGDAIPRAVALADEMIAAFPRDPDVILCATTIALVAGDGRRAATWARRLMHPGRAEDARAGLELVAAIGAPLSLDDERFLAAHPPRRMASDEAYAAALDDGDRRELIDDAADRPLRDVLALLAEALPLVCPTPTAALAAAGLGDAVRVTATNETAAAAMYPQIARALGGPPTLLYTSAAIDDELTLLCASPPVVVIGRGLASMRASTRADGRLASDAPLRFQLGRVVERSRPHRLFAALPDGGLARLVAGLQHGFGPSPVADAAPEVVAEAQRLRTRLSVALRQRLAERLAVIPPARLDPHTYAAACERAADRAGLLVCGDVGVAIELAGGARHASHLVRLAASRRYLAARQKLRGA